VPELPDLAAYVDAIERRVAGAALLQIRLASPFLLRSVAPPLSAAEGRRVEAVGLLGKRLVLSLDGDLHLVLHLMIAGRLHWKAPSCAIPRRHGLAGFDFERGTLLLTEAGSKRRASLHLVEGRAGLAGLDRGGLDVLASTLDEFARALAAENHTLKRALTDPRLFAGIGNAYSDEILHAARLSPLQLTGNLDEDEVARLHDAVRFVLTTWIARLKAATGEAFPEKVTAFRDGMAVHGRFGRPCPDCGAPVQRIVYAENEANYCATCQTGGRLLADRALSRLLRDDWPRRLEDVAD
jgi:formamidopyrimidine-DNA glycosylase